MFAPHGLFSGNCLENIRSSGITEVIVTNTLPEPQPATENIKMLSIGKLLAEVISLMHKDVPINQFRESRSLLKYYTNVNNIK
jgi:ribose-phosphate pyrophosphokinase